MASVSDMLTLSRRLLEHGVRHLHLSWHSPTLKPGLSPFAATPADVMRLYASVEAYLDGPSTIPLTFTTVSEAAEILGEGPGPPSRLRNIGNACTHCRTVAQHVHFRARNRSRRAYLSLPTVIRAEECREQLGRHGRDCPRAVLAHPLHDSRAWRRQVRDVEPHHRNDWVPGPAGPGRPDGLRAVVRAPRRGRGYAQAERGNRQRGGALSPPRRDRARGGAGLYVFFTLYEIPKTMNADAHWAFGVMVLFVSLGFIGMLPEGVLAAQSDFVPRNVVRLAVVVLRLVLTLALLSLRASLAVLALVQLAGLVFHFTFCWLVIHRRYPAIRVRLREFDWAAVRRIFSFSLFVLVLNAGARLSFETDSLVIGAYMDVSAIPHFTVANSFLIYLMEFMLAIAAVVMPLATRLHAQHKTAELRGVYLKWSKIALSLSMMAGLFLIVLDPGSSPGGSTPTFEQPSGQVLQILMLSYLVFLPMRGVALPILMGKLEAGPPDHRLPGHGSPEPGIEHPAGPSPGAGRGRDRDRDSQRAVRGARLGAGLPRARDPRGRLPGLRRAQGRARRAPGSGAAALVQTRPGRAEPGRIAAAGVAMVLLFGLTWVLFVYRNDPYVDLRGRLSALRVEEGGMIIGIAGLVLAAAAGLVAAELVARWWISVALAL